ncbi:MAG: nitroreductase family deazaflavin-dependent oxidoreductase, partial [Anaerolineae bacterium]|nr:nitroreductase family deazaflavin-dependent oxidoreductase [Anaerolineae bacterium]
GGSPIGGDPAGDGPPGRLYVAREVVGEERAACWAKAVAVYPGYEAYARRAGREIPVVVVEKPRPRS